MSEYSALFFILVPSFLLIYEILRRLIGCESYPRRPRPYVSGCIHKMRGHYGHVKK